MTDSYDKAASPAWIDLPVFLIVRRALLSPFFYLPEFIKFGGFTILLTIGASILAWLVTKAGAPALLSTLISLIAQCVITTKGVVTWMKLMIGGRTAIRDRSVFRFGRIERRYLVANGAVFGAVGLSAFVGSFVLAHARQTYDRQLVVEAVAFNVVLLVALFIASIRISFVFPAIATDTYSSLKKSWSQTKGHFERLLGIVAMTYTPFFVLADIFVRLTRDRDIFGIGVARWIFESLNATLAWSAFVAGVALAYKILVLKAPVDSLSAVEPGAP